MPRLAAVLTAAAMLLAACGDDEEGDSGNRLSKAEFSKQGAKICRDGAVEAKQAAAAELRKPETRKLDQTGQQLAALRAAEDVTRGTLDELGALRPPEDIESRVDSMREGILEVYDVFDDVEAAAKEKDRDKLKEATDRIRELADQTRSDARAAGLDACLPENTP